MTKVCTKCNKAQPINFFYKDRSKPSGYRPDCKTCSGNTQKRNPNLKEKQKIYRQTHKNEIIHHKLKCTFGIGLPEFNDKLMKQNNSCAICRKNKDLFKRRLSVDHRHKTNRVRGLLCSSCNTALGLLKEDFTIINNLIQYLTDWNQREQTASIASKNY